MSDDLNLKTMEPEKRAEKIRELYAAIKAVSEATGRNIPLVIDDALGGPDIVTPGYESNFRKGKIAMAKAITIHKWLAENHFDIAQGAAPDLFEVNPISAWQHMIDEYGVIGKLRIVKLERNTKQKMKAVWSKVQSRLVEHVYENFLHGQITEGIVERVLMGGETIETLRLTQPFCFELHTEVGNGVATAFQKHQGIWKPLPLGSDERRLKADISYGQNTLPRQTNGTPVALAENNEAGHHQFAVIVSTDHKLPTYTLKIAKHRETDPTLEVHMIDVRFVT